MNTIIKTSAYFIVSMLCCAATYAASTFDPASQPLGYIAPAAVSDNNVNQGAVAFLPKFNASDLSGDLIATNVSASGTIDVLSPVWIFSQQLDAQDWDTGRYILTMHKDNYPVPFRKDDMDKDAVKLFKKNESDRIDYIRGDRAKEGDKFRERNSVLSTIIHSNPVYVGQPQHNYGFDDYDTFKLDQSTRNGAVYVGSNSGMVHAIDAATGNELFAYVPRAAHPNMKANTEGSASISYSVDGPITAEDVFYDGSWKTVVVGGLGAGGQGLYALDATSDSPVTHEGYGSNGAAERILWEFNLGNSGSDNLGYTYSRPSIVKLNNGKWAAIIGNGYMSDDGKASLYVLDIASGNVIKELVVPDANDNGLSSPTLIDTDGNRTADYAYAGDLNGNIWKFDLSGESAIDWTVAYSNKPLFTAYSTDGSTRQAITTAVDVGRHPSGGVMIYAATGRLLSSDDASDITPQNIYGIRDIVTDTANLPYANSSLLTQYMTTRSHSDTPDEVRTATNNQPNWNSHKGWRMSLDSLNSPDGERVIQDITLRNGRIVVSSMTPYQNGHNWLLQLNAVTGGAPEEVVFDVNKDGVFSIADNVDGNGDGNIEEIPVDRVAGIYEGMGLSSRVIPVRLNDAKESLITNHIFSVAPTFTGPTPGVDPGSDDYGLVGGHMDLDVSSRTYPIDGGATDKHDHEWDNDWGNIVDFFTIDTQGGFRSVDGTSDSPGASTTAPFIVNIANAGLSPGGILEINGADFPVRVWQAKVKRYLSGTLEAGEWFPIFTLEEPTTAQKNQGIIQLTGLKMKFFADAIIVGGLHPTQTGCVKGNEPSPSGEYRNGALTTQLLDASGVLPVGTQLGAQTPINDVVTNNYEGVSFAIHSSLNYARPPAGKGHGSADGLFWESTLFWHWGGGCYTTDNANDYADEWGEEVGGTDTRKHDDAPGTGSFTDPYTTDPADPADSGGGTTGSSTDGTSDHFGGNTPTPSLMGEGRLFWREWVPDNN